MKVEVETASLHTSNWLRDRHLLSSHYLDGHGYPEITFSGRWEGDPRASTCVPGVLVIRGIANEVELVELCVENGIAGALRVSGSLLLDRERFGLAELCVLGVRLGFRGALIAREIAVQFDVTATEQPG